MVTVQTVSSLHALVTPPGSSTACPLTPPPTNEKYPSTVLRIVEDHIRSRRAKIGPSRAFAQSIKFADSSRIKLEDAEYGAHDPDRQFQHPDAPYPGVVIELSYSQKKGDLPHLAGDYILGSDSNIQFEPEVVKDEDGDVLIAKQTVDNQLFRTPIGTPPSPPNHALEIPLQAFAPSSCYPFNVPPQGTITIPSHTLYTFLQDAEKTALIIVQKTGLVKPLAANTWGKKRRRDITPEDELLELDEKSFKAEEDKALELETEDEGSFKGVWQVRGVDGGRPSSPDKPSSRYVANGEVHGLHTEHFL
ncbi:hypothetical protein DL98DRAFT_596685 [Cadophora sp. DSE1049]|nr:hypothetical protein DL98DRAFT_596685 [Cadophora sp. DSE1049]